VTFLGTDATIAQHIQTIIDRDYVVERVEGNTKYLVPSKLGIGLIEGYDQIGHEKSLSQPALRREVRVIPVAARSLNHCKQLDVRRNEAWYRFAKAL
jgi:DNA topoisomerase-3